MGTVAGRQVNATLDITARLINQPPTARISSSQSVDQAACVVTVALNALATTDPDENLSSLRWFDESGTFVGEGSIIEIPVRQTGEHLFRLVAEDDIGGASTAEATVEVTFPLETCIITVPIDIRPGTFPNIRVVPQ